MTSKNSFLVRVKENNKRRLWVWIVSLIVFVLVWPAHVLLLINQVFNNNWYVQEYGENVAKALLKEDLLNAMDGAFGISSALLIAGVTAVAVVSAIQGFSWLFSRKKIDFYMGMPVKRKKRFLYIWLNGILVFIIPYLLGMALSTVIAMTNGGMNGRIFGTMISSFGIFLLFYLGVYHMAILAVMLTGNVVITVMGFGVFCLYEWIVRGVYYQYHSTFFKYFNYYDASETPLLSPFVLLVKLTSASGMAEEIKLLIGMAAFALIVGVIAYVCYLKRPAEAAGKALTFKWTGTVIKIMLIVPGALFAAQAIGNMINFQRSNAEQTVGYLLIAIAVVVVFGSGLIQAIYEFDIRGMLHQKKHILISGVLTAFIFAVFYFDMFGYDTYVPDADKVETAALIQVPAEVVNGQYSSYFEDNNSYLSEEEFGDRYMYLTNVDAVCQLAERSMTEYDLIDPEAIYDEETNGHWSNTTLIYRLKNGRKVIRQIYVNVDDEQSGELLDQIIGSEEFNQGALFGLSSSLKKMIADETCKLSATYGNSVYNTKMSRDEILGFLEAYGKDAEKMTFSNLRDNLPVGGITLDFTKRLSNQYQSRAYRSNTVGINVYPFMENCISYLREHGCYFEYQLNPEDVDHIQVVNSNSEKYQELYEKQEEEAILQDMEIKKEAEAATGIYGEEETIDTRVYADYTDEARIRQIAESVYTENVLSNYTWINGNRSEYDYTVIVYFKADSEMSRNYGVSAYYAFAEGKVPEFVQEDTAYKE